MMRFRDLIADAIGVVALFAMLYVGLHLCAIFAP
jgi:hypothetical protein